MPNKKDTPLRMQPRVLISVSGCRTKGVNPLAVGRAFCVADSCRNHLHKKRYQRPRVNRATITLYDLFSVKLADRVLEFLTVCGGVGAADHVRLTIMLQDGVVGSRADLQQLPECLVLHLQAGDVLL